MFKRGRRVRATESIRELFRDVDVNLKELVYPLFIKDGNGIKELIPSMPNQFRFSIDTLATELSELEKLGIKNLLLFGIPKTKDLVATSAFSEDGIVQQAVRFIKKNFPSFLLVTDVCMCAYTTHGHCGIVDGDEVLNDESIDVIAKIALSHAQAGADIVAPSDMMDGRILRMREVLDQNGFVNLPIMSYAVKYASSYYGPFRDIADSAPKGDRKTYQLDFRNSSNYLSEAVSDIEEGADIVMVKPGLAYLDVLRALKDKVDVPLAIYNVSGEYSMVKAAAQNGWIDEKEIVMENMIAMKRAGASIIITYHAKDIAIWQKGDINE